MTTPAEKFSLDWKDFQKNAADTFCDLLEERDFCDVTLVCEDNQQLLCHKVVLASSSPVIKDMLRTSSHSHPLLYFWGVKARDLARLVDFIYRGQVQLYRSDLQDFLNLAEILKVKGVIWDETRQENYMDQESKELKEYIVETKKTQDSSKSTVNEHDIVGSKYLPSYENKIHYSEQLLTEEIYKAFNIHDVPSRSPSPVSLESYDNAPHDAFDDSPAGSTDSQSPFTLSKKTYNKGSGLYPSAMRSYRDKCTIQWRDSWTQLRDCHGDKLELWAQQITESEAKCVWCQNTFKFDSKGVGGILLHAKSLKHKANHDELNLHGENKPISE